MGKVMMTIKSPKPPTLDEIQQRFGLNADDLDHAFGVIEVDPNDGMYTFMVDEGKAAQLSGHEAEGVQGPYSNPKISPFGPPEP